MPDDDDILSQEQIDALLAGVDPHNPEKAIDVGPTILRQAGAKSSTKQPSMAPTAAASSAEINNIIDLVQRVANLEETVSQFIPGQLQDLTRKLESLITAMQGTVGYDARHSFVCSSCQNKGNVAARLNCTSCGEENWWGWWPQ